MSDASSIPDGAHAFRSRKAWLWFLGTIAISFAIDIATKYIAFHRIAGTPVTVHREEVVAATPRLWTLIPQHEPVTIIPKVLDFTLVLNPGAVFGIGAGKRWFFVVFTALAVAIGSYIFAKHTRAQDRLMHIALGLVLGGGLGNLYDRLIYACVRDFIHPLPGVLYPFGTPASWAGKEVWPYVSNVADAFLIVGVVFLAWRAIKTPAPASRR